MLRSLTLAGRITPQREQRLGHLATGYMINKEHPKCVLLIMRITKFLELYKCLRVCCFK